MSSRLARSLALLFPLALFIPSALLAPSPARSGDLTAEQIERIGQIKALQQSLLLEERFEGGRSNVRHFLELRAKARAADSLAKARGHVKARKATLGRQPSPSAANARREAGGVAQRPLTPRERKEAASGLPRWRPPGRATESVNAIAQNVRVNDVGLDNPSLAVTQAEPAMVAWKNNVLAAWNDNLGFYASGASLVGIGYSTNNGQSFVAAGPAPEPHVTVPSGLWTTDPVLAVNERTGDFYFCALIDPFTGGEDHGVGIAHGTFVADSIAWDRPHIRVITFVGDPDFIDKPWIAADSVSGNVYLTFTRFTISSDYIVFMRSTDQGASWGSQITLSSPAGAGRVQGSRPVVGPDGEVYVVWQEIGPPAARGADFFRIRKSTDLGRTFGPEVTVTSLFDDFGSGAPGFNRAIGVTLPSIAVDRSDGPRRGRVYVAWNESLNYYDSIPDESQPLAEVEPNDDIASAQTFIPGQMITGTFSSPDDFDFYRFDAHEGVTYLFLSDQVTTNYTMRILCTDGSTRLAYSGDPIGDPNPSGFLADGFIVWTAPTTGTYYLRMVPPLGSNTGRYRVRTSIDTPGGAGQRARDHRDVFLASSPDGLNWSTAPVRVNNDPQNFDDWLPEVAVTSEGTVYVAWYDWSDSPVGACGGLSHTYVARSDDGGTTWVSLGAASDGQTAWSNVNADVAPNQGDYLSLFANSVAIYPCWSDGRLGNPDIVAAPFLVSGLQIAIERVVADADHVAITWRTQSTRTITATVYKRAVPAPFVAETTITSDAQGRLFYDDGRVISQQQYQYRLGVMINGIETFLGERTVVVPAPEIDLQVSNPVPTADALRLTIALPTNEKAWVALFDLTGRRIREWYVGDRGVGRHAIDNFGHGLVLKPGYYMLRLKQGELQKVRRIAIIP